jgi:outer membrane receptor protein involved in Fe transport
VDEKRRFALFAVDFDTEVASASVRGEAAVSRVDVPEGLEELFGEHQWGFHVDVVVPVLQRRVLSYPDAVLNAGLRLERVDFNVGTFASTDGSRDDEVEALVLGLSFRPTPGTVLRFNYRRAWFRDLLSNPAVRTAGYQVGLATYF